MPRTDNSTRYPFTYACDLLRSRYEMSRADAAKIRVLFSKILEIPDEELAVKMADYHLQQLTRIGQQEGIDK